ncbi:hypothetical protein LNO78_29090 [Klebsiella pneumoniae subsp. pneumoniae]|nr:hypothetical protein [Klebsiella pneumoniae subsp. pneumoniae]
MERIAQIVAREVLQGLRDEVGEEVDKRLKAYLLGDMTATQHSIQHANLDKLLNRMDAISSGFFGGVVSKVTSFLITALLLGLAAYGVKRHWKLRGKG